MKEEMVGRGADVGGFYKGSHGKAELEINCGKGG